MSATISPQLPTAPAVVREQITILVLKLKPPSTHGFSALLPLLPGSELCDLPVSAQRQALSRPRFR